MSDNFLDITYETTGLIQSSVTENVLSDDISGRRTSSQQTLDMVTTQKTLRILLLPSLSHLNLNNFLETSSFSCSMSFLTLLQLSFSFLYFFSPALYFVLPFLFHYTGTF